MRRFRERSGKRAYHHGNLREALIDAAIKLIAERGLDGVTLSEAARMAGVSAAAPYRHFKDRSKLLIAIAKSGYARFADALEKAWDNGRGGPVDALHRLGAEYIAFARREPARYAVMFESGILHSEDAELAREADRAFGVLRDAAAGVHAILPRELRAPPLMMALHIWSQSHGIASLFLRGDAGQRNSPVSPEELLESSVLVYLDGLGLSRRPSATDGDDN